MRITKNSLQMLPELPCIEPPGLSGFFDFGKTILSDLFTLRRIAAAKDGCAPGMKFGSGFQINITGLTLRCVCGE